MRVRLSVLVMKGGDELTAASSCRCAQDEKPKVKAVLNHLRGGSRTAQRKEAAAAADAIPPSRLWTGNGQVKLTPQPLLYISCRTHRFQRAD